MENDRGGNLNQDSSNENNGKSRSSEQGNLTKEEIFQLQNQLDRKNRELVSMNLIHTQRNNALQEIYSSITSLAASLSSPAKQKVEELGRKIKNTLTVADEKQNFKVYFEQIHPNFYDNLSGDFNSLTQNELRHCAYIRLNMPSKEIAQLLNITPKSVSMAHYRIRRKINLPAYANLFEVIKKY